MPFLIYSLALVAAFILGVAWREIAIPWLVDHGRKALAVALPTAVSAAAVLLSVIVLR